MRGLEVTLGDAEWCQSAIESAEIDGPVIIEEDLSDAVFNRFDDLLCSYTVHLEDGRILGRIGRRSQVAEALNEGQSVLHASVKSKGVRGGWATVRLRVVLGQPGEQLWAQISSPLGQLDLDGGRTAAISVIAPTRPERTNTYRLSLVGESHHQPSIATCSVGDVIHIVHERGNPFDPDAMVALTESGARIGYVGRDSWLKRAAQDEGKGCTATVASIDRSSGGSYGVVLNVRLCGGPLHVIEYAPE